MTLRTAVIRAAVRTTSAEYQEQIVPTMYVSQTVKRVSKIMLMGLLRATPLQHRIAIWMMKAKMTAPKKTLG